MALASKGLEGIVANETELSDVRGEEGELIYRGYNVNELVRGGVTFEEVIHLLHRGRLPNRVELGKLTADLRARRSLPKGVVEFLQAAPKTANPMDVLRTGVSMLGLYDDESGGDQDRAANEKRALDICARVPLLVAAFHRFRQGLAFPEIRPDLNEAAHFLFLINGSEPSAEAVRTLDLAFMLHAEHGMNASTFSARVTIATLSDMYSAITAAVGTLKGPLHGGANEGVIHMLKEIGDESNVEPYIEAKLAQKEKIMGIGHRIYRTLDPRAPHLRDMAVKLTNQLGEPKWIRMSERIAAIMKERKKLNANVDFYSATVYYSLGIPTDLFTPVFAIARTAGWTAQVLEQLEDNRLYRPLSDYIGPAGPLEVTPIDKR
ncbi:MAG: citrate/2-methylcitrate synthase [Verrucomicrobiales bacterium]